MSEKASAEQILVLVDGSEGSRTAAALATEIARCLGRPLAILGVSGGRGEDAAIADAVSEAQAQAREKVSKVEAIQSTGEIFEAANRRVSETPTFLVVLGANPRSRELRQPVAPRIWRLVKSLSPPVLVAPSGSGPIRSILFCTGGERFIEEGARMTARLAQGLAAKVVVFHVSPHAPEIYGEQLASEEESPDEFLGSNSRLARNIARQIEIFRAAGVETAFHVTGGEVVQAVLRESRHIGADLVVVGSSPTRGPIRTHVLGDFAREIAGRAGKPFLVVRSRQPGFWSELWRALTERTTNGKPEDGKRKTGGV